MRCDSLDVDKACGLDVLHKEVAQRKCLERLLKPKFVDKVECRCAVGKDVNR